MNQAPDPLETLLGPKMPSPVREDVFSRTLPALRRQRWQRRLTAAAALTATYAAGVLTVLALPAGVDAPSRIVVCLPEPLAAVVASTPTPPPVLEWQALDNPESAAGLYREAADQYLVEADPTAAVRCYGNALDAGKAENLEASSEDSWLLMAIKHARKKERKECEK